MLVYNIYALIFDWILLLSIALNFSLLRPVHSVPDYPLKLCLYAVLKLE